MTSPSTPARVAVLLITIVVALVLLLANTVAASGSARRSADSVETDSVDVVVHRVVGGDTLWDIAAVHTPEGDDIRYTLFEIRQLNDLDGSVISPGQLLRIPSSD
jgi:nucleoid-associated protein YgaU